MANAKQCDICGKFWVPYAGSLVLEGYILSKRTYAGVFEYDLCDNCKRKLTNFAESIQKENNDES